MPQAIAACEELGLPHVVMSAALEAELSGMTDEDAAEYEAEDTDAEETEDAEVFEDDDDGDDVLLEDAAELGDDDGVDIDVDSDDDDSR